MSPSDFKACKLNKNEARKQVTRVVTHHPDRVFFTGHARDELASDGLTTVDVWNVLKSPDSKILIEGEFEKGSFRYRLETANILVVVAFQEDGLGLTVVTTWRKKKGGGRK